MTKKTKKRVSIGVLGIVFVTFICFLILITLQNERDKTFLKAHEYMEAGNYDEAEALLGKIPNYDGSSELLLQVIYERGCSLYEEGKEAEAELDFQKIRDYQNAKEYLDRIALHRAESFYQATQYDKADEALKNTSDSNEILAFKEQLYRTWTSVAMEQQDYETAYNAAIKMVNPSETDKVFITNVTVAYGRKVLQSGDPDRAESILQTLDQSEEVAQLTQEIKETRLAVTCVKDLKGRYVGEIQIGELLETRCSQQTYKGTIQIPVVMIRFTEYNTGTGEVKEAYAIYDNDVYMLTSHALQKNQVDMKNATEMAGYLKLSQNWDTEGTKNLSIEAIKKLTQ